MKTNIQEKKSQLQYFQQETQKSKDAIQSLEKDKVAVQEKYTFYAETREFVDDFVEFMDAKVT